MKRILLHTVEESIPACNPFWLAIFLFILPGVSAQEPEAVDNYPNGMAKTVVWVEGNEKVMERIYLPDGRKTEEQRYLRSGYEYRSWHENGRLSRRMLPLADSIFQDEEWYENGTPKASGPRKGKGRGGHWWHFEKLGEWSYYREDSSLSKRINYLKEIKQGLCEEWYPDGKRQRKLNYKDGKVHGDYVEWDENGFRREEQYEMGNPSGKTQVFYPSGERAVFGQWQKGAKSGLWRWYYPDGRLLAEGQYESNSPAGTWRSFYPDGKSQAECSYNSDGWEEGRFRSWFPNGQLRCEGEYAEGDPTGEWKYFDPAGNEIHRFETGPKAIYHDNLQTLQDCNRDQEGKDRCEVRDEYGRLIHTHLVIEAGTCVVEKTFDPATGRELESGCLLRGARDGIWTSRDSVEGIETQVTYRKDQAHGPVIRRFADGSTAAKGQMYKEAPDSIWKEFYPSGGLRSEERYDRGILLHSVGYGREGNKLSEIRNAPDSSTTLLRTWHTNGKLRSVEHYKEGKKHGLQAEYDEKGNPLVERQFDQGKWEGKWLYTEGDSSYFEAPIFDFAQEFYPDGKLKTAGPTRDGKKDGLWTEYAPWGDIKGYVRYKMGKTLMPR